MRFNFLLVLVLSIGLVSGISVCIDNVAPSAPANLSVSGDVGSILLGWDAATDEPSCSGIDYYNISRDGDWIGQTDDLSFVDNASLGAGEYAYTVYAVDLIGHNTGAAVKNVIVVVGGSGKRHVSGGSSSSSYVCSENWSCEAWSECVGTDMRRLCDDLNECGTENDKPDVYQECGESSGGDGMSVASSVVDDSEISLIVRAFSAITGAVVGAAGTTGGIVTMSFIVLALGGFFAVRIRKKKLLSQ